MSDPETDAPELPDAQTLPDMRETEQSDTASDIEEAQWPADSPMTPLGQADKNLVYLDYNNVLITRDTRLAKNDFVLHCGGENWLWEKFPAYAKLTQKELKDEIPPRQIGFDHAAAGARLSAACARKGIFNPDETVFGRGAHKPESDEDMLILHCGKQLLLINQPGSRGRRMSKMVSHKAGAFNDCYFPGGKALPLPDLAKASTGEDGRELLDLLGEWNWADPEPCKLLVLGMIGQMYICGALDWRAHIWLTGSTTAGKSYLQKLMRALLGPWALKSEDASAAYIWQKLKLDKLAVMVDEAETDDDAARQQALLTLARKGSSGGNLGRGSSGQEANDFSIHSAFVLSSIIHSIKVGQDRNRFAILDMLPIPDEKDRLNLDFAYFRALGRRFHRRMIDQWPRFHSTLQTYMARIHKAGFNGRWQDTFGTLLACADLLLYDCHPSDANDEESQKGYIREEEWVRLVEPMMYRGKSEAKTDTERCIHYLLSSQLPGSGGDPAETIGRWIVRACEPKTSVRQDGSEYFEVNKRARDKLKSYGLRVFLPKDNGKDSRGKTKWGTSDLPIGPQAYKDGYLAIAGAEHRALGELFRTKDEWAGGGWTQSFGKAKDLIRLRMRFEKVGQAAYVLAIPLKQFVEKEGVE